jgi:hypothetical protein
MNREQFIRVLVDGEASPAFIDWVNGTPGTPQALYERCRNATYLHWLITRAGIRLEDPTTLKQFDKIEAKWGRRFKYACTIPGVGAGLKRSAAIAELVRSKIPWGYIELALKTKHLL